MTKSLTNLDPQSVEEFPLNTKLTLKNKSKDHAHLNNATVWMESVSCRLGSLHDVEAAKVRSVEDALHGVPDAFERLLRLLRR